MSDPRFSQDPAFMGEIERVLGKDTASALIQTLDTEIEQCERSAFLDGFKLATQWVAGPKMAPAAFAVLVGDTDRSDGEIARELGVTPQAVGKFVRKLRRNAEMGLRKPEFSNSEEIRASWPKRRKDAAKKKMEAVGKTASAANDDLI